MSDILEVLDVYFKEQGGLDKVIHDLRENGQTKGYFRERKAHELTVEY